MEQARFGPRFIAIFLDWTAANFIASFVAQLLHIHSHSKGSGVFQLLTLLVFLAEVAILTALTQSSMGQKLVRLKVVDAETGGFVPPMRILLRTVLIVLVLPVVFTKEGRGYHDVLAKTIVVRAIPI